MGRLLVFLFLGSVAFTGLTVFIGLAHLARDLLTLVGRIAPGTGLSDPPRLPAVLKFSGIWFLVAVYYFFVILPVGMLVVMGWEFLIRGPATRRTRPPALDWSRESVAVVLTAYNDEAAIGQAVEEFRQVRQVERVIVVDNNSRDRTAAEAIDHGAEVVREGQQGYGYACMRGLRHALRETQARVIVLCEGDMTFFGNDLEKFLPYIADCDMVVGTRTTRSLTREGSQLDWFMIWGNIFIAFLLRLRYWDWSFFGIAQVTDVGCTFRAIRRDSLEQIVDQLTVGSYHFSPHMILVALQRRLVVAEVPIRFRARVGQSKGVGTNRWRGLRVGLAMMGSIAVH